VRRLVEDVEVHFVEHGRGLAVLGLHGAGVDHREIEAWLDPILAGRDGYRRIYPDLPGMGRTPAAERLTSNDDVVAVLLGFLDQIAPEEPFLVVGHSYGAYLARAVVAQRRSRAVGLALVCPIGESTGDVPGHEAFRVEDGTYDVLPADQVSGFDDYFVVRTPVTARRYRDAVAPGVALVDETGLGRIFAGWAFRNRPEAAGPCSLPALILTGRQDSTVGYAQAAGLLRDYPHATYAVLDGAGHALPHEQPELVASFVNDWITRAHRASADPHD
jgi:pimeloyl-ACP methyl ester carboxylesterase